MNQKGQQLLQHQKGVYPQNRYRQGYHSDGHDNQHGQRDQRNMPERQNLNVVWQALLQCASFAERQSSDAEIAQERWSGPCAAMACSRAALT